MQLSSSTLTMPRPSMPLRTPARAARVEMPPETFGDRLVHGLSVGLCGLVPPLVGGMSFGVPGALAGGAVSLGLQYFSRHELAGACQVAAWSTLLGSIAALNHPASAALGTALALGAGTALGFLSAFSTAEPAAVRGPVIPINKPGERVNVEEHLVPGKTNIVCFSAPWCPACQQAGPKLEALGLSKPEFITLKVNIDKWESPVAQQYKLDTLPTYRIYDGQGKLTAQGDEARGQVKALLGQRAHAMRLMK